MVISKENVGYSCLFVMTHESTSIVNTILNRENNIYVNLNIFDDLSTDTHNYIASSGPVLHVMHFKKNKLFLSILRKKKLDPTRTPLL